MKMRHDGGRSVEGGDVLKGLAAGVAGGLAASWVMNQFQEVWTKLSEGEGAKQNDRQSGEESEDATVRTAEAISENLFGHELTKEEKEKAGPAVHYGFGSTMGALYGVASEVWPRSTAGAGTLFGAAVWLGADEAALPLLGLSKPPTEYPASTHAYALASHFVYGLTTDAVRRVLRATILH